MSASRSNRSGSLAPGPARWARLATWVVVGCLGLAACTQTAEQLDRAATERAVGRSVAAEVQPAVLRTTCPDDLPRGKGERSVCRVTLEGADRALPVEVTQPEAAGKLTIRPLKAVVDPVEVAVELRRDLVRRFRRAFLAQCGEAGPTVVAVGHTFTCIAGDRDGRKTVDATVTDTAGTLRFRIRQTG